MFIVIFLNRQGWIIFAKKEIKSKKRTLGNLSKLPDDIIEISHSKRI
jgi:hypothetical protein